MNDLQLKEDLDYEKSARVYYQKIVYDVCNILDDLDGRRISHGEGIVCGTVTHPSTEVQDRLKRLVEEFTGDIGDMQIHDFCMSASQVRAADMEALEDNPIKAKVYYTESARARDELSTQEHSQYHYAAVIDVIEERDKQRLKWSAEHDDGHTDRALANNAARLAIRYSTKSEAFLPDKWGLEDRHPDPRERLVIAAALLIAEIERIDRLEAQPKFPEEPPREILGMHFTLGPHTKCVDSIRLDITGKWWVQSEEHSYEWRYFWDQLPPEEREVITCAASATTTRSEHNPQTA